MSTRSSPGNNVGGWRSGNDFIHWPLASSLLAQIGTSIAGRVLQAWAVMHRDGSFHNWHTHDGSIRTGVCYLTSGGGRTMFQHDDGTVEAVAPERGLLVVFPASLRHRTEPHTGGHPRITVAFNATRAPTTP